MAGGNGGLGDGNSGTGGAGGAGFTGNPVAVPQAIPEAAGVVGLVVELVAVPLGARAGRAARWAALMVKTEGPLARKLLAGRGRGRGLQR